jgi:hypothetical protein
MSEVANTKETKRRGRWKKGESGNPNGRPKEGQSWAAVIKRITDMSKDELLEYVGGAKTELGRHITKFPPGIPMKDAMVIRALIQLMFEPDPRLFNSLTDREEGKPKQPIVGAGEEGEIVLTVRYENRKPNASD